MLTIALVVGRTTGAGEERATGIGNSLVVIGRTMAPGAVHATGSVKFVCRANSCNLVVWPTSLCCSNC